MRFAIVTRFRGRVLLLATAFRDKFGDMKSGRVWRVESKQTIANLELRQCAADMAQSHVEVLQALAEVPNTYEFSIIKLSEPVYGPLQHQSGVRTSDVSADVFDNPSPASLEADLAHYKASFPLQPTYFI